MPSLEKVALVGSGNWGSAIATKIGLNVLANDMFDKGSPSPALTERPRAGVKRGVHTWG